MSDNLKLWCALEKTDPTQTTSFKRDGGFAGTAIKPIWTYKRLTEVFGPCGKGWGVKRPTFQTIVTSGNDMLVYCTVEAWYVDDGERYELFGVGGDKVSTARKNGYVFHDDEAFKKAFTDAITNAFKMIGSGADIHMGMFDDSKYVNSVKAHFHPDENKQETEQSKPASKNADSRQLFSKLQDEIRSLENDQKACVWWRNNEAKRQSLPEDWQQDLTNIFKDKRREFTKEAA